MCQIKTIHRLAIVYSIRNKPLPLENRMRMKDFLCNKLRREGFFWSYDNENPGIISDDIIIEKTLIHLDYTDYQYLFSIYPKAKIKKVWISNIATLGAYYYTLNYFIAWFCFGIKNPKRYLNRIENQLLN